MRTIQRIIVFAILSFASLLITSCCDCDELPSDEELREMIIGTWVKEECEYPFVDSKDITESTTLLQQMTFNSDGSIAEVGLYAYCCSSNCDTVNQGPCNWVIESGKLIMIPDTVVYWSQLNQWYPIRCLDDDLLVFDNVVVGTLERTKTCYRRQ